VHKKEYTTMFLNEKVSFETTFASPSSREEGKMVNVNKMPQ
jgi:hypothetical protein